MSRTICLVIICSLYCSHMASAVADDIIETGDTLQGRTQAEYANTWWQWAVSMPDAQSPIKDRSGVRCAVNQAGPVWFLAGGFGTSRISRECRIPSDRHIFFPVINMLYYPSGEGPAPTCDSVKLHAAMNNRYLKSFKVTIDDHSYVNPAFFRRSSADCFDLIARKPGTYTPSTVFPSATDGYWVMLRPLSPGRHTLSFRAEYNRPGASYGAMIQDIEYTIDSYE